MSDRRECIRFAATTALFVASGGAIGLGARALLAFVGRPDLVTAGDYDAVVRQAGKPVVLFSRASCPWCARSRELLTKLEVDYAIEDIDASTAARGRFLALAGRGVPLAFSRDVRIEGFDETAYRKHFTAAVRRD